VSEFGEGEREIDGERGLADPAFAGADRDDGVNAREWLRSLRRLCVHVAQERTSGLG
jgi:hypothetical protein